jgi:hypothetical protein
MHAAWQGELLLSGITWFGVTALALFVTFFYEREEGIN